MALNAALNSLSFPGGLPEIKSLTSIHSILVTTVSVLQILARGSTTTRTGRKNWGTQQASEPGGGAASTGISPRKSTLDKEQVKPGGSHGPQRPEAGIYPTALARQHPMTFAGVESQTPPLPVAPPVLGKGSTMQIQHLTPVVSKARCCRCLVSCVRHFVTPRIVACQVLCPWNFPGKNTGVGSHSLLQGIFPTKGLKPGLLHCRWILYHLSHQGNPAYLEGSRTKTG